MAPDEGTAEALKSDSLLKIDDHLIQFLTHTYVVGISPVAAVNIWKQCRLVWNSGEEFSCLKLCGGLGMVVGYEQKLNGSEGIVGKFGGLSRGQY